MSTDAEKNDEILSLESRQKKEKKELQAQVQALKRTAKNDKTKKKDILVEISRLEIELDKRHKEELEKAQKENSNVDTIAQLEDTEQVSLENGITKVKISKAQKRRDKKHLQEKERDYQIKLQEKENLLGPRFIETQEISSRLKHKNLQIYSIPSDGDCLYKAVMHQLLLIRNITTSVDQLRVDVADYIRKNKNDFLPFMSDPETFDMLSEEQFEAYCDKISTTTMWGGQLEVKALSNILKCPINIIQATGPECIEQGSEFPGEPLVVTYHRHMYKLGEHYNSTCELEEKEK